MMKRVNAVVQAVMPWVLPAAWLAFALYMLFAGAGCGPIHIPNPFPTPTPTPRPPAPGSPVCTIPDGPGLPQTNCWEFIGGKWTWRDCQKTGCPAGQTCVAGHADEYACVPNPSPVCEPNTNCDCWVQPPGQDWSFLTCTAPNTCVSHVCKTPPPPEPVCPEQCPAGQQCTDPKVGCVPIPPPPVPGDPCPPIISTAKLILNDKPYGNGFDSSPRLLGDENACFLITHEHGIFNCSFEGWPARAACEMKLMGGCPVWQYQKPGAGPTDPIFQCHDDRAGWASCDHFGDPVNRDDPQTPTTGDTLATLKGFEGTPRECGLQRDALGPNAGFFTIAHGEGQIQACFPNNPAICGPWRPFNF